MGKSSKAHAIFHLKWLWQRQTTTQRRPNNLWLCLSFGCSQHALASISIYRRQQRKQPKKRNETNSGNNTMASKQTQTLAHNGKKENNLTGGDATSKASSILFIFNRCAFSIGRCCFSIRSSFYVLIVCKQFMARKYPRTQQNIKTIIHRPNRFISSLPTFFFALAFLHFLQIHSFCFYQRPEMENKTVENFNIWLWMNQNSEWAQKISRKTIVHDSRESECGLWQPK